MGGLPWHANTEVPCWPLIRRIASLDQSEPNSGTLQISLQFTGKGSEVLDGMVRNSMNLTGSSVGFGDGCDHYPVIRGRVGSRHIFRMQHVVLFVSDRPNETPALCWCKVSAAIPFYGPGDFRSPSRHDFRRQVRGGTDLVEAGCVCKLPLMEDPPSVRAAKPASCCRSKRNCAKEMFHTRLTLRLTGGGPVGQNCQQNRTPAVQCSRRVRRIMTHETPSRGTANTPPSAVPDDGDNALSESGGNVGIEDQACDQWRGQLRAKRATPVRQASGHPPHRRGTRRDVHERTGHNLLSSRRTFQ